MHTYGSVNGTSILEGNLVIFSKIKNDSNRYSFEKERTLTYTSYHMLKLLTLNYTLMETSDIQLVE